MKKILLFCLASTLLFSLGGCKKCETCTTTISSSSAQPLAGYPTSETETKEYCDDDLDEVKKMESTSTYPVGNNTVTMKVEVDCK